MSGVAADSGFRFGLLAWRLVAARLFWLALIAMHIPALTAAVEGVLSTASPVIVVLRLIGLLLTVGFFAFKAAGGRVLPTRTKGWIAAAAFLALTGVAHAGLMPSGVSDSLGDATPTAVLVAGVVGVAATQRRRIARRLDALLDGLGSWIAAIGAAIGGGRGFGRRCWGAARHGGWDGGWLVSRDGVWVELLRGPPGWAAC